MNQEPMKPDDESPSLIVAQLSDLHLTPPKYLFNNKRDGWACLDAAFAAIYRLDPAPNYIVVSGDIADSPSQEVYEAFRERTEQSPIPVYAFPGNHDHREMFKRVFSKFGYLDSESQFAHFVIESSSLRVVVLDTLDPPTGEARLCDRRLQWLEQKLLERPEQPTMIFMHHQPLFTRLGFHGSAEAFPGVDGLRKILRRYPNIEGIACGHLHRPIFTSLESVPVCIAPSTTYQRTLTMHNDLPKAFIAEPLSIFLHLWHPETRLVTHTHFIGEFGAADPMINV